MEDKVFAEKEATSSNNSDTDRRPRFGNRILENPSKVFEHNAWDNVDWSDEMEEEGRRRVSENSKEQVSADLQMKYENECDIFWNNFYKIHQNRFFKDRHWLFTEFPELDDVEKNVSKGMDETMQPQNEYPGCRASKRIFEVGCGVGNTVYPILQTHNDDGIFIYCCDISELAIQLVKEHENYSQDRCYAFVGDITNEQIEYPFPEESLDVVILIFVLSAIHPNKFSATIRNICKYLKPGGLLLFRDYGRYDLAQLRFKKGHFLQDNFYVRGDGTRVYFFSQEELDEMFRKENLVKEQNYVDRRLQVNRGRQLKMYRVWIQCKYRKPFRKS
ncbi:Methyltransferase-like protein 2-A [Trichoplax sp. H2]|uniref:tRNA N(3)-methylcytidine methyltransferase n=1 Tax=Trichoplax adhaerens TaxID=10228 RepID=B3RTC0_TRIAD|nr:hypothetical protein TRIADDRAFT_22540 [Trichoplax adhaerens]EDV27202.1 hypothetical protein TRIADDRAFT_22540 [Trichoplax adhaerens]RDD40963.1 Methyltransferase-like protein 2-A [Trichoplax sp. H2]|eukprot:XP_002111198.1 hypothetical protein TRIADDRAFT_22540 [Trichoplax adhaerens]